MNRQHPGDKSARLVVARGEAAECEATLEMAHIVGIIETGEAVRLRRLSARTMALIGGLIRYQRRLTERGE